MSQNEKRAGLSYVLIHSGKTFALFHPHLIDSAETILALPMALSEIMLAFRLIFKGIKNEGTIIKNVKYDTPNL